MGEFPSEEVLLGGICLPTAAQAVLPALGLQSLQVPLERRNPTTITPPQTLCQDTVVTQPWACVPPLSTRLMDTKKHRPSGKRHEDLLTSYKMTAAEWMNDIFLFICLIIHFLSTFTFHVFLSNTASY